MTGQQRKKTAGAEREGWERINEVAGWEAGTGAGHGQGRRRNSLWLAWEICIRARVRETSGHQRLQLRLKRGMLRWGPLLVWECCQGRCWRWMLALELIVELVEAVAVDG